MRGKVAKLYFPRRALAITSVAAATCGKMEAHCSNWKISRSLERIFREIVGSWDGRFKRLKETNG
jgi:hypothetical protein